MYGEFCKLIIALAKKTDLQIIVDHIQQTQKIITAFLKI